MSDIETKTEGDRPPTVPPAITAVAANPEPIEPERPQGLTIDQHLANATAQLEAAIGQVNYWRGVKDILTEICKEN